jgi:long-chain acyl-CoA synthetase
VGRTLFQVLKQTAARHGAAPALRQPKPGTDEYTVYSWIDYQRAAEEIAAGLRKIGLSKGDIVALDSETRLEFYIADMGILAAGCVAAALYPTYPAPQLIETLRSTGAKAAFVENPTRLAMLRGAPVRHWILLSGWAEGVLTLEDLREIGRGAIAEDPGLPDRLEAETRPTDPAILYLTSGATGDPKAALVSHEAVVANIDMGPVVLPLSPNDAAVAFLPSAHITQRVVMEFLPMRDGMPVTFSESLLKLPQEIRKVRPTLLVAPPRFWERIYSSICTELRRRGEVQRKAFYGALGLALAAARYRREGKPVPLAIRVPLKAADAIFFRPVRARFGGRLRVAASGAAPLSKDLAEFYEAIGMPLVEGYGLTEGGVTMLNPLVAPRPGSIGKPLPGVRVLFSPEGELLIKTPCLFMGYLNDPQTTDAVVHDGWLHTGDLGHADEDGFIYITGRKKDLIVSSTGRKIFPARLEAFFKIDPLISQVLLIGDGLPYVTALFTVNVPAADALKGMAEYRGLPESEFVQTPPVLAELKKSVARVNKQLAPFEQIRRFRVLPRDFSIEQGELTATMKLRRTKVIEAYKEHIKELYAGRE